MLERHTLYNIRCWTLIFKPILKATPVDLPLGSTSVMSSLWVCVSPGLSLLRIAYLGLTMGLRTVSFLLCILGFVLLKQHLRREECSAHQVANGGAELEALRKEEVLASNSDQSLQTSTTDYNNTERDTRLWQSETISPDPSRYTQTHTNTRFAGTNNGLCLTISSHRT